MKTKAAKPPITALKRKIAWEIQALRDRQIANAEKLTRRRTLGIPVDEIDHALDAEGQRINERIEALQALDKARRSLRQIARDMKLVKARFRHALIDERDKILRGVKEVRAALAI